MKEKYVGKVKVPLCVVYSTSDDEELSSVLSEITGQDIVPMGSYKYYGIRESPTYFCGDYKRNFGDDTATYTLEELQAIIDSLNNIDEDIPELDLKTDSDGWIPWSGGYMPIPKDTLIDVKHRDGEVYRNKPAGGAANIDWYHSYEGGDIIAYRIVDTAVDSSGDDTATLDEDEYVGVASGETVSTDSVGSSVSVTANISFDVVIKGQTFTLTTDELQELYIQLCGVENYFREWSLDV